VSTGSAIAVAVTFVWLGMVLAISFLEAPLKFRAPNVTLQIGLGIGRLVFRALNTVEVGFALVIIAIVAAGPMPARITAAYSVALAALAVQLIPVRPRLTRRSDKVLAGHHAPRSRGHYVYVGLEAVKALALVVAGILLLAGWHRPTDHPQTRGSSMDSISLTTLASEQLAEAQQSHSGRAAHTIHGGHTHELRQTVLALLAGHDLSEHDSPGEATLQVLQGHVRLTTGDDTWDGGTGDYVAIPHERHALHAVEDSVIMLTVLKSMPAAAR
jgi:quercetin dioxygenase-like cupin family protein